MKRKEIFTIILLSFSFLLSAQAKIEFDSLVYNIKPVIGQESKIKIPFRNTGSEPLIITQANSTKDNSIISTSHEPIAPKKSGYMDVSILNNHPGAFRYHFSVRTNCNDEVINITINTIVKDYAIERNVKGIVYTSAWLPLKGVIIAIEGRPYSGTITDIEGKFSIKANTDEFLIFSFMGMVSQKLPANENEINVNLQESDNKVNERLHYDIPNPNKNIKKSIERITADDSENATNPKYNFRKASEKSLIIIYLSDLHSLDLNDVEFQRKYGVRYSITGSYNAAYYKSYNKLTFKLMKKRYQKSWLLEIRKDAIGLDGI